MFTVETAVLTRFVFWTLLCQYDAMLSLFFRPYSRDNSSSVGICDRHLPNIQIDSLA